jgi:dTDP-4-amino-4,6-dideoxygalactose transaminase
MSNTTRQHAKFGAAAYADLRGRLPQPYPRPMGANTMKYLQEVVDSGLTVDMTGRFERAFASAMGVKHCVSAPGCTNAIAVLAASLGLAPGDEVVMSPIADYGTVMGFINVGLIPVFADTDPAPGKPNVTVETIASHLGTRTRAIVCVHKTGIICDMDPIVALGRRHDIPVFEDACQAAYGKYKGRYAGTLADGGVFSFDSEKSIGSDVGGCLITNDDRLAETARFMGHARGAEMRPGFGRVHTAPGLAMRMPQCTAAVTLAQIEEAPTRIAARDRAARRILRGLKDIPGIIPLHVPDYVDVYSCWMMGFSLEPAAFRCTADEFGRQLDEAGLSGASTARYYLLPAALPFLTERAAQRRWPYDGATASRPHRYDASTTPHAARFLEYFIRWTSFCEKYTDEHTDLAVEIVRQVVERNRS